MSVGDVGSKPASAAEKMGQCNQKSRKRLPDEMGRLKCSCCGELKDVSDFSRSSAASSGRQSRCKECLKNKAGERLAPKRTTTTQGIDSAAPISAHSLADLLATAVKLGMPEMNIDEWSKLKPSAAEANMLKAAVTFLKDLRKTPEQDAIDETWATVEKDLEQHVGSEMAKALARLAALVGREAEKVVPSVEVLAGLGQLKAMAEQWAFPPELKTRRISSTIMDYWCFVLGAFRLIVLTRLQLSSEGAAREDALKRLLLPGQRRTPKLAKIQHLIVLLAFVRWPLGNSGSHAEGSHQPTVLKVTSAHLS